MLCLAHQEDSVPTSTSQTLNGSNGFQINGIDRFDYQAVRSVHAGDVNGDGFDDRHFPIASL